MQRSCEEARNGNSHSHTFENKRYCTPKTRTSRIPNSEPRNVNPVLKSASVLGRVRCNFAVRLTRVTWLKENVWTKRKWKSYFWIAFSCGLRVPAREQPESCVWQCCRLLPLPLFCIIDCQPHTVWLLGCRNWLQHALLIIKILSGRTNLIDCHASPTA
jgi:hypothetical protein